MFSHAVIKNAFIKVWFYDIHISMKSHIAVLPFIKLIGMENKPNYYHILLLSLH